jgi:hypothetical protein
MKLFCYTFPFDGDGQIWCTMFEKLGKVDEKDNGDILPSPSSQNHLFFIDGDYSKRLHD